MPGDLTRVGGMHLKTRATDIAFRQWRLMVNMNRLVEASGLHRAVKMKLFFLGGILGIGLFASQTQTFGATINVVNFGDGTPSLANAQLAYNAASAGDTIVFPGGSATWATSLVVKKPLTLVGNGTTLTASSTSVDGIFYVTGFTSSALMRITGFTINLVNFNSREAGIQVLDNISLDQLRIDHNTVHFGFQSIVVGGSKGVIDHNFIYNSLQGIVFTAGSSAQATASWVSMAAGTGDALFIEDNEFIDNAAYPGTYSQERIGSYNGGKLVVRYNRFDSTRYPNSTTIDPIQTHGSAAGGVANGYWQLGTGARRGQSVVEIYNNTVVGKRVDFLAILRGSANLVHDNTLDTQTYPPRIVAFEEEQTDPQWNPLRTAWPAEDQVHNSFFWNNTLRLNGVATVNYVAVSGNSTNYIQEDRDYFLHAPQDTGGREIFTGENGASNTFPTDGVKYPTKGTMRFEPTGPNAYFGYTPFTYPHPLTGSTVQPAPPQNLRVVP